MLRRLILAVLWIVAAICLLIGWPMDIVFRSDEANSWVGLVLALSIPLSVLMLAFSIESKRISGIAFAIGILGVLVCGAASLAARMVPDTNWDLIGEARSSDASFRLYRTNCGATCAYGLVLTREVDLLFGIRTRQLLWSEYPSNGGGEVAGVGSEIRVESSGNVLFTYDAGA